MEVIRVDDLSDESVSKNSMWPIVVPIAGLGILFLALWVPVGTSEGESSVNKSRSKAGPVYDPSKISTTRTSKSTSDVSNSEVAQNKKSRVSNITKAPPAKKAGIRYWYYEGEYVDKEASLGQAESKFSGELKAIGIEIPDKRSDAFAVVYEGMIKVEKPGRYEFELNSDDSSFLWINNKQIVSNGGNHPAQVAKGRVELSKGSHSIKVVYCEGTGEEVLSVKWKTPDGGGFKELSVDVLYYTDEMARSKRPDVIAPLDLARLQQMDKLNLSLDRLETKKAQLVHAIENVVQMNQKRNMIEAEIRL